MHSPNPFRDFADWRLRIYEGRPRESVRFFRRSLNHSMVWMLVMRGYFDGNPPTVGECQDICRCSRLTTRKLIADAVQRSYFDLQTGSDDLRKRSVSPTRRTIDEYVEMVQGYLAICETMRMNLSRTADGAAAHETPQPIVPVPMVPNQS
jgi:hypothetical protein